MRPSVCSAVFIIFGFLYAVVRAALLNDSINQGDQDWLLNLLSQAPAVKLRVIVTSKTMEIHGQSVFDVFAKPVVSNDSTYFHYDGVVNFLGEDLDTTYLLVDGASYVVKTTRDENTGAVLEQSVNCYLSDIPFDDILPALKNAIAIPNAYVNGVLIDCPGGQLLQTSIVDADFVLCTSGASGFTAYGLGITVEVEYLSRSIQNISVPASKRNNQVESCPVVVTPTQLTPTAIALVTGETIPVTTSRNLKEAFSIEIGGESCECKSTPRPCIFLHGLGNPNEKAELQDTPKLTKEKFGDIGGHAPCCTTVKYAVLNTVDYGWTNDTLQQKFCNFSLSMSKTSDLSSRTIADTIVVTHSMGGLVMAGALATGKCKFANSTSWVSLSAPMKGSMAGDYIQDLCDEGSSGFRTDLLELLGQCPASIAKKSIGYENGRYSTPERNAAYIAAQEAYRGNVTAALCSTSYHGVFSKFYPSCLVGGMAIPHKSKENDGLVEFQSCLGGLDPVLFGDSYRDRFYSAKLNHADTAFLTHDGFFRKSQKPFKWFECLL
ncbi:hypothetical protein PHMEG_00011251 [Phytophthora megakarya]|uniref:GPI inositol-deacylase n=1 Tax=Phytophthora megakarya TaxID=4795 RepID=A0A225WBQ4_9STRA|nr:hypothetical protein PHMEG_00011251 [Phytophthora megakarya]